MIVISPDGALVASTNVNDVVLTPAADGTRIATTSGHTQAVTSLEFDRTGARLLIASQDGTVRIWDAATGGELRTIRNNFPVFAAGFRNDDRLLVGDTDSGVTTWDSANGFALGSSITTTKGTASIATGADGHTVVGGGMERVLTVWQMDRSC